MPEDPAAKWLKRVVLLLAAVFLCVLTVFVWRVAGLVKRLDASLAHLSFNAGNLKNMASGLTGDMLDPRQIVDEVAGTDRIADPVVAREIDYLMECIGNPACRYQYGNDNHGASWVQAKLAVKFRAKSADIKTAEDFIREVASKTHDNETYYIIQPDGSKSELSAYLTQALNTFRAKNPEGLKPE